MNSAVHAARQVVCAISWDYLPFSHLIDFFTFSRSLQFYIKWNKILFCHLVMLTNDWLQTFSNRRDRGVRVVVGAAAGAWVGRAQPSLSEDPLLPTLESILVFYFFLNTPFRDTDLGVQFDSSIHTMVNCGAWIYCRVVFISLSFQHVCVYLEETVSKVRGSPVDVDGVGSSFSDCDTADLWDLSLGDKHGK